MCLQGLLEALQKGDDGMFASHLAEYDSICRLDSWKTKILLQVGVGVGVGTCGFVCA